MRHRSFRECGTYTLTAVARARAAAITARLRPATVGRPPVAAGALAAGVLPAGQVDVIKRFQHEGPAVATVGDGANRAAALAQAGLGLASGAGPGAAIEAAGLTLAGDGLRSGPGAIERPGKTPETIRATSPGPSAATRRRSRWPRPACSTP